MAVTLYTYAKKCDAGRLRSEIMDSSITIAIDRILTNGTTNVYMKDALSTAEETVLNDLVTAHVAIPLEEDEPTPVKIEEGDTNFTGGHTLIQGFHVPITQQGWNEMDITFPFNIAIFSATWNNDEVAHAEDMIELHIAPETLIGQPTQDVAINDTVIDVPQSVLDNVKIGFWLILEDALDSENTFELGRVVDISQGDMTVTVENAAAAAWAAATTLIKMTVKTAVEIHIMGDDLEIAGSAKIGGSKVPANTVVRARYYCDTFVSAFTFHFRLQMSY